MEKGFCDYLGLCRLSQPQLCILLDVSKSTLYRYIQNNEAPRAVMLIMRSLCDGFPPLKNKEWNGYKIYENKLYLDNGEYWTAGDLRKLTFLRMNGLIPWHGLDDSMSFSEWKNYISWVNDRYLEAIKLRKSQAM